MAIDVFKGETYLNVILKISFHEELWPFVPKDFPVFFMRYRTIKRNEQNKKSIILIFGLNYLVLK